METTCRAGTSRFIEVAADKSRSEGAFTSMGRVNTSRTRPTPKLRPTPRPRGCLWSIALIASRNRNLINVHVRNADLPEGGRYGEHVHLFADGGWPGGASPDVSARQELPVRVNGPLADRDNRGALDAGAPSCGSRSHHVTRGCGRKGWARLEGDPSDVFDGSSMDHDGARQPSTTPANFPRSEEKSPEGRSAQGFRLSGRVGLENR